MLRSSLVSTVIASLMPHTFSLLNVLTGAHHFAIRHMFNENSEQTAQSFMQSDQSHVQVDLSFCGHKCLFASFAVLRHFIQTDSLLINLLEPRLFQLL